MGCKSNIALGAIGGAVGINRYIVGCKYDSRFICFLSCTGINRYIVGCKFELLNKAVELGFEN